MKAAYRLFLPALLLSPAVQAQAPMPVIAVPPLTTPSNKPLGNTTTLGIAWQASQLIAQDLRSTGELMALAPDQKDYYSYPEVTAPTFWRWRSRGAKALLTGFVQARSDGRVTVGCYVYDVDKGRELGRIGFVADADDWRRAAHKCSGLAYERVTGSPGTFDTRIAYVAETGLSDTAVKRIAVMDSDGQNHDYVTPGGAIVLTPRLSPHGERLAFVSYMGGVPHVQVADLASGDQRPLVANGLMSFAPRYSPDGGRVAFSMVSGGNSDIYVVSSSGGVPQRLTTSPGVDTDPSFSPDGSKILFESDRSGSQQLYVMNADGSAQRRISFGGGSYAAPDWSPDGAKVAFVHRGADGLRIGTINPDGSGEQLLTTGPRDEGPSWAASSHELIFGRTDATGRSGIYRLSLSGGSAPRRVTVPQDGSDPDWSGARD